MATAPTTAIASTSAPTNAAPTPAQASGSGPPPSAIRTSDPETPDLFDPSLLPSVLPRILSIVDCLYEASQDSSSLISHNASAEKSKNGIAEGAMSGGSSEGGRDPTGSIGLAHPDVQRLSNQDRSDGPSIALGQVSDDDTSLYDFLFSSASTGASLGNSAGGGVAAQPSELSLRILREARELRDVYRSLSKAVEGLPGGEWEGNEQKAMIRRLEEMKERERQAEELFERSASIVLQPPGS